ncbi:hypothetical protein Ocin01_17369 [Orchesella cincta]|uniref:E3 ubiquitin-protein ligase APD1-4 middle domain-containing protein n=1 Tax=Orchesella cincta TaxID=48709 RepID=A0A1D2M8K1_ORCCI|nr:hypothetical protein Ocin01_17369 [Orchesella cincta]
MANSYGSSTFARPPGIPTYQYHSPDGHSKWKGPRRVCIFCTMAIVVPSLLISIPLLMRFVIYGSSSYVIHPSDMRVLDERISTTWCEEETVRMNASFTAYVTHGEPNVFDTPTTLTVDQNMKIPDDQKEYWGLYLLPGSTFRVRTCARYKGGTVLIVRGNKHMKYCAYVGEGDSAGNSDEVSGSTSVEVNARFRNGQVKFTTGKSKEIQASQDDLTILSKLKSYLQTHPNNRDQLQKTLEDWMLLNSSSTEKSTLREITVTTDTNPLQNETDAEPEQTTPDSLEHGVIHRSRRSIDVRPDTESGENGAFEDNSILEDEEPRKNLSVVDLKPFQTPDSIWKDQHNQHSGVLNDTLVPNDGSDSESESSFSSSEEALLKCEGVIASFTIPQEDDCTSKGSYEDLNLTKNLPGLETNVYEFSVKEGDYYYFIFGSENEKYTNSIRAKFELQKVEYKLPEPVENCTDVMECQISFGFASSQKVVVKVPQPPAVHNNSNLVYVVETECKPRAHLYLIFVILVPLVILIFAFQ